MRIAIFSDSFHPELSGVADMVLSVALQFSRAGHEVHLFVPGYSDVNYEVVGEERGEISLPENVKIHRVFSLKVDSPNRQGRIYVPNPFRGIIIKGGFDVVHSHGFFGSGIDAFLFAKIKRTKLVGTNHTIIESFVEYFAKGIFKSIVGKVLVKYINFYYNLCDLVTTPSVFLLDDMKKKGLRTRSEFVPNPVDPEFFEGPGNAAEIKASLSLGSFNVLYAGRLSPEKNSESMIRGFIPFARKHPDATLSVVGGGILKEELERISEEAGAGDQIRFVGPFVGGKRNLLLDYFHASDVFLMTSTSENQSMCVIQAMAAGLPVIGARACGLPELIGSERGLTFVPDDLAGIEECLEALYVSGELRESQGGRCREFAKKQSAWIIAARWITLYEKLSDG